MTEELTALARRAVACHRWRWMRGMVAVRVEEPPFFSEGADPSRLVGREYLVTDVTPVRVRCVGDSFHVGSSAYVPDLTDPATLGCLLTLVREAWSDAGASVWHDRRVGVWSWMADGCTHGVWRPSDEDGYATEAEALVAALEAAP